MKSRLGLVLALAVLCGAGAARAQPPAEMSALADSFFSKLQQGDVANAYHGAFASTEAVLGSQRVDSVVASTMGVLRSAGAVKDWAAYQTDVIAPSLVRKTYLVRCAEIPLFVTLQFYNSGRAWNIVDIQINSYTNGANANLYDRVPKPR